MQIQKGQKLVVSYKPVSVDSELYDDYESLDVSLTGACSGRGGDFSWIENGVYVANTDVDLSKYNDQKTAAKVEFKILN